MPIVQFPNGFTVRVEGAAEILLEHERQIVAISSSHPGPLRVQIEERRSR